MSKNYIIFGLILLLGLGVVSAYPNLNGQRVSDFANILAADQEAKLTTQIYQIENITGAQFAIVTVANTEGDGRVDYAARIGEQNGVGIKGKDNGVVILWSLDNEKGGAIATGRGIGDILTDAKVANIGRAHRAEFDTGEYYLAFSGILIDIQNAFPNNTTGIVTTSTTQVNGWVLILLILGIGIILIIIAVAASEGNGGSGGSGGFSGGYIGSSGGWSSSSSGGGGFSGGSFGGGGGGF